MSVKIIAGDFPKGTRIAILFGQVILQGTFSETLNLNNLIENIELVTEESKKRFLSAAGLGLVGGAVLGPAGLFAGVLAGGRTKEICFACYLKDGRKFLAVTDPKTYRKLLSITFG